MKIGFHTDAFNSAYWNFEECLRWAQTNDVHYVECGVIDGVSWIHGLGYQPHVALYEDVLRRSAVLSDPTFRLCPIAGRRRSAENPSESDAGP